MQSKLPVRKSKDEIAFYIKHGKVFGDILHTLYDDVTVGKLRNGIEIQGKFFDLVYNNEDRLWTHDVGFPFQNEKNYLKNIFQSSICVSVNDVIAHGRPTKKLFKKGDVVSVDCGISLPMYSGDREKLHFDSAFTTTFETPPPEWVLKPHSALRNIKKHQPMNTYSLAETIERTAHVNELDVMVMLTGHGIGYSLHEKPEIRNATGAYPNVSFFEGLCFCAEPIFVKQGEHSDGSGLARAYVDSDGWSIKTTNSQPGSHFETMFCVSNNKLVDVCGITNWFCQKR